MSLAKLTAVVFMAVAFDHCARAEPCLDRLAGYKECEGILYKFHDTTENYDQAFYVCKAFGGRLAAPKSAEENKCVNDIRQGQTVWLGFTDNAKHQEFVDINGKPISYKNWSRNEPNDWPNKNKNNEENCASMWHVNKSNGEWNDYACSRKYRFVCQIG